MALKIQQSKTRDRQVRFERKSVTRDADFNSEVIAWVPVFDPPLVWASVLDALQSSSETTDQGLRLSMGQTKVETCYFDGIDRSMRIVLVDRSRTLQIVDIAEIGRKGGLQFACQEFSA